MFCGEYRPSGEGKYKVTNSSADGKGAEHPRQQKEEGQAR